jgi:hypothetical protein
MNSEQQQPVINDHYFWVPRVNASHKFGCIVCFSHLLCHGFNDEWNIKVEENRDSGDQQNYLKKVQIILVIRYNLSICICK